ncbi:hypothetical protein GJ496_005802 [Pomphorhynchus laevis]|nr:hypothetical protein GJ496_005802 [Pomphorhynchus laevis]
MSSFELEKCQKVSSANVSAKSNNLSPSTEVQKETEGVHSPNIGQPRLMNDNHHEISARRNCNHLFPAISTPNISCFQKELRPQSTNSISPNTTQKSRTAETIKLNRMKSSTSETGSKLSNQQQTIVRIMGRLNKINELINLSSNNDYTEPTLIIPNFIYLGNCISSIDYSLLRRKGITNILNMAANDIDDRILQFQPNMIHVKRVALMDTHNSNLLEHVAECVNFLDNIYKRKQTVLVHCSHGQSRSPAIVIAYMMIKNFISLEQCLMHILKLRPCVSPNNGFLRQLMFLEYMLNNNNYDKPTIIRKILNGSSVLLSNSFCQSDFAKSVGVGYLLGNTSKHDREYVNYLCSIAIS